MADHYINKVSHCGNGYSVVDLDDVRHLFATAAPTKGTTFDEQADDALRTMDAMLRDEGSRKSIVHQAVFLPDLAHVDRCREIMRDFYGADMPATSYIPQSPCGGKLLSVEVFGVGRGDLEIQCVDDDLVIARHNGIAWVHCDKASPPSESQPAYCASLGVLRRMCQSLGSVGARFDQVIRAWFYLGGITDDDGPKQRYQEFNRARSDFFRDVQFLPDRAKADKMGRAYPASTGIGTAGRGVAMSAMALVSDRKDIRIVPLENPRQTAAYDYAARYCPQSPKFSRAMAISCGTHATIFISGTASICNSETVHPGDPTEQTEETLDNIAALISERNLASHGLPGMGMSLAGLAFARVYIKRPEDYAAVRTVCERRLGALPTIYATADVCRQDLLVEIEGVAVQLSNSRRSLARGTKSFRTGFPR